MDQIISVVGEVYSMQLEVMRRFVRSQCVAASGFSNLLGDTVGWEVLPLIRRYVARSQDETKVFCHRPPPGLVDTGRVEYEYVNSLADKGALWTMESSHQRLQSDQTVRPYWLLQQQIADQMGVVRGANRGLNVEAQGGGCGKGEARWVGVLPDGGVVHR